MVSGELRRPPGKERGPGPQGRLGLGAVGCVSGRRRPPPAPGLPAGPPVRLRPRRHAEPSECPVPSGLRWRCGLGPGGGLGRGRGGRWPRPRPTEPPGHAQRRPGDVAAAGREETGPKSRARRRGTGAAGARGRQEVEGGWECGRCCRGRRPPPVRALCGPVGLPSGAHPQLRRLRMIALSTRVGAP